MRSGFLFGGGHSRGGTGGVGHVGDPAPKWFQKGSFFCGFPRTLPLGGRTPVILFAPPSHQLRASSMFVCFEEPNANKHVLDKAKEKASIISLAR